MSVTNPWPPCTVCGGVSYSHAGGTLAVPIFRRDDPPENVAYPLCPECLYGAASPEALDASEKRFLTERGLVSVLLTYREVW